jgi:pimeloyl-ACP methyl ester carboxylesterase
MTPLSGSPLLPSSAALLTEATSLGLARQIKQAAIPSSLRAKPIRTSFVHQPGEGRALLLLHGFDSSILEFRRLIPQLQGCDVWAIDLFGFGFCERSPDLAVSPATIRQHLYDCWQHLIQTPVVLVGASMGGTVALDFALSYPQAVDALVLLDSAGIGQGPWIGKYLVPPLDRWAVEILRRPRVRRDISRRAYYRPDQFATADAERCAALHLDMPYWDEALRSFTRSGGYPSLKRQLPQIHQRSLILWGRQDHILGTGDATTFLQLLPQAELIWVDDCGHVPHLEQPELSAKAIRHFLQQAGDPETC